MMCCNETEIGVSGSDIINLFGLKLLHIKNQNRKSSLIKIDEAKEYVESEVSQIGITCL